MRCTHPVYIPRTGAKEIGLDGKRYDTVPCGKCLACRKERSKAWAIRCMMESTYYEDSIFATFTYDPENLSYAIGADGIGRPTLLPKDLQDFWKRLRKELSLQGRRIKYYACGEYGDHTFRPHYHAIIFGLSFMDKDLLCNTWKHGLVDVEPVTLATCNYVAGYVQKKLYGAVADEVYLGREKPFSRMSKKLSAQYVRDHYPTMLNEGFIRFQGKKLTIPRYFWKQIEQEQLLPKEVARDIKKAIINRALETNEREYNRHGIYGSPLMRQFEEEKLDVRDRILHKQDELYKRGKL